MEPLGSTPLQADQQTTPVAISTGEFIQAQAPVNNATLKAKAASPDNCSEHTARHFVKLFLNETPEKLEELITSIANNTKSNQLIPGARVLQAIVLECLKSKYVMLRPLGLKALCTLEGLGIGMPLRLIKGYLNLNPNNSPALKEAFIAALPVFIRSLEDVNVNREKTTEETAVFIGTLKFYNFIPDSTLERLFRHVQACGLELSTKTYRTLLNLTLSGEPSPAKVDFIRYCINSDQRGSESYSRFLIKSAKFLSDHEHGELLIALQRSAGCIQDPKFCLDVLKGLVEQREFKKAEQAHQIFINYGPALTEFFQTLVINLALEAKQFSWALNLVYDHLGDEPGIKFLNAGLRVGAEVQSQKLIEKITETFDRRAIIPDLTSFRYLMQHARNNRQWDSSVGLFELAVETHGSADLHTIREFAYALRHMRPRKVAREMFEAQRSHISNEYNCLFSPIYLNLGDHATALAMTTAALTEFPQSRYFQRNRAEQQLALLVSGRADSAARFTEFLQQTIATSENTHILIRLCIDPHSQDYFRSHPDSAAAALEALVQAKSHETYQAYGQRQARIAIHRMRACAVRPRS